MKTLLRVLAVAMAATFTVDAASAATANTAATVNVTIGRRSERVAIEAERMTRYMTMVFDLTERQESKLFALNIEWADRCDRYTNRIDLDYIVENWYYEYTRDLDMILNNRQMRKWRNRYGVRFGDCSHSHTSVSINIGARPHVHVGVGHKHDRFDNPHTAPHTKPHVVPHVKPHTEAHVKPHTAPHVAPHNGHGDRNNKGQIGNGGNRPSNNKGSYRSSNGSNRDKGNANRDGGATRSSNGSNKSNDRGHGGRGR
ncbi:MAG: hypothetical protein IKT94_04790 [Rikenellaceae bacterium]|nr:hypothetical protein [Rikenellaceae bacterium]